MTKPAEDRPGCCELCTRDLGEPPYIVIHGRILCPRCATLAEVTLGCLDQGYARSIRQDRQHWEIDPCQHATLIALTHALRAADTAQPSSQAPATATASPDPAGTARPSPDSRA